MTITDKRMTRFWVSLEKGVRFVISCSEQMLGGEVFVPKIPSMKVIDLARAVAPKARIETIGIRPGEKLHEVLISEDEARSTVDVDDMYVVQPVEAFWFGHEWQSRGKLLEDGSDTPAIRMKNGCRSLRSVKLSVQSKKHTGRAH